MAKQRTAFTIQKRRISSNGSRQQTDVLIATKTRRRQAQGGRATLATVAIPAPDLRIMELYCIGDAPLIVHRFSEKAQKQISDKHAQGVTPPREKRNPAQEVLDCLHVIPGKRGVYGFPSGAFKEACIYTTTSVEGISQKMVKQAFQVMGTLVELRDPKTGKPAKWQARMNGKGDPVRLPRGGTDIRYRPEFLTWAVKLIIRYNASVISPPQLVNLLNTAGFACGIGEWRPGSPFRSGPNGIFHVATEREIKRKW